MQAIVQPSNISGQVTAPASKSAMQRACAAALVAGDETLLHNPGLSADDKAAMDIITQLGAKVQTEGDTLRITSNGVQPVNDTIHCGESGLSVRMFTPIAALSNRSITVTGQGSLLQRPLDFFDEVLPRLEVSCRTQNGRLPMEVRGPLKSADIEVDGSLSSQFLTGLLLAYAAAGAQDVTISVRNLNSKPYIDLTLQVMKSFGLKTPANDNYERFHFDQQSAPISSTRIYTVEGDWSGGAFLLVAGAIAGGIQVDGLDVFSSQADKAILQALMQCGAVMSVTEKRIDIGPAPLKPFHLDATDCPDLFPPLVALASACDGRSVIEGVHRLTHKESNRALTLREEFGKMGIEIMLQDDLMVITGGKTKGAQVQSHHDHRIAMACAVAALRADGPVTIDGAEAVNKSYPQFWDHLKQLKAELSLNHN